MPIIPKVVYFENIDMLPRALLMENDCLDAMNAIPDGTINLILCDLPYGTTQNAWDSIIPLDMLWTHYRRILAPRGVVALMSQGSFTARVILSQESLFKYKITWIKSKPTNFLNAKKQPLRKHEDVCVFYAQQPNYSPQMSQGAPYDKGIRKSQLTGSYGEFRPAHIRSEGERYPTDVVYFKTAEAEGRVWHPTQKPVELGRYLIRTYTSPEDVVLDNCFGSASFIVAAALEKRNAIGIELNKDIAEFKNEPLDLIEVAHQRLSGIAITNVLPHSKRKTSRDVVRAFLNPPKANKPHEHRVQARQHGQPNSCLPALA